MSDIDWNGYTYYVKAVEKPKDSWEAVPDEILESFDKLGIPQSERDYMIGSTAQYESKAVYSHLENKYKDLGVIYTDTDTALWEYPNLVKEYFGSVVKYDENFQTALNSALWSRGTFIYVPKGVVLDMPVQTYFRMNNELVGQLERTLVIVEEGASINCVEGCTAPVNTLSNLHGAVVEIIVKENAYCRYTTKKLAQKRHQPSN